ncbi:MAG TPA: Uma2 family endonuclease [Blastocatellia bacterium]|nr:Uma2 family endonuclease [Blastocatellia bacterium]
MSVQIDKWVFTVDEYNRMTTAGILTEDDRVELIRGELIRMSPIGSGHAACVKRLNNILGKKASAYAIISVQDPVQIDNYSLPQPDLALLTSRADFYSHSHPTGNDVLLIIEVSDTSIEYDRNVKLPLYAEASIIEVWLVNLREDRIEVYSRPVAGKYKDVRFVNRGESISPIALPDVTVSANEILG